MWLFQTDLMLHTYISRVYGNHLNFYQHWVITVSTWIGSVLYFFLIFKCKHCVFFNQISYYYFDMIWLFNFLFDTWFFFFHLWKALSLSSMIFLCDILQQKYITYTWVIPLKLWMGITYINKYTSYNLPTQHTNKICIWIEHKHSKLYMDMLCLFVFGSESIT